MTTKLESLKQQLEDLQTLQNQLKIKEEEVDRLVAMANAKQIKGLIDRLNNTLEKEMKLRHLKDLASRDGSVELVEGVDYITMRELKRHFATGDLLEESEQKLKSWVASLIKEELETFEAGIEVPKVQETEQEVMEESSSECPSALSVIQDVQAALTKYAQDGIGMVDHLQGSHIVHSMTSPTYTPPPSKNQMLGNVWWRKFIPEDWEGFLPSGWEEFDTRIPSYLQHTFVS